LVFNNTWDKGQRNGEKWAKKPECLPLDKSFVLTEAKVLLAYFLLTARLNYFIPEVLGSRTDYLDIQEEKGVLLAHLGPAQRVLDLTKDEVDKILDGWPPFYRECFLSWEGHLLRSPLKSFDQTRRPAWIVAIGLGGVEPADAYIQRPGQPLFSYALDRLRKVLLDVFEREWKDVPAVHNTRFEIENMRNEGATRSHNPWKAHGSSTLVYREQPPVQAITQEQCEALLRVFSDMEITQEDKTILDVVLEACMARVSLAVYTVLKYGPIGKEMQIPSVLQGNKAIYLRDCTTTDI
jgi:hypothetical protein